MTNFEWHDGIRIVTVILGACSVWVLAKRFRESRNAWNVKTRDIWFAMVLWSVTAIVLAFEGLHEDRPVEPRLIFYSLATAVMFKGIWRRGAWGGDSTKLQ